MPKRKRGIAVGLTGNISSGKSTVLSLFSKLGCKTLSLDNLAHELIDYDASVKRRIIRAFGEDVIDEGNRVDRKKLANIVFNNPQMRKELEKILHPAIKKAANEQIGNLPETHTIIVEAPLLFESGWDKKVDHSIMVTCPIEIRKTRFYSAGKIQKGEFERRDSAQWSEEKKLELSTFHIDNSMDLTKTISQVRNILKEIKQMA